MKIITIRDEPAGYVANTGGNVIARAHRLADMKLRLVNAVDGNRGKIIYRRPSWPGMTSPVTLFDCRPERNFRSGPWAA